MARVRTLAGISVFWVGLSMLGDGFSALVVPLRAADLANPGSIATVIGLVTFVGLLAGMLVQPIAGAWSDRLQHRVDRRVQLFIGALLILAALGLFLLSSTLLGLLVAFVALQVALNGAQAVQQSFIPRLVDGAWHGRAAGLKGFADVGGAFLGFLLLAAVLGSGRVELAVIAVGAVVLASAVAAIALVREGTPVVPRAPVRSGFSQRRAFLHVVVARFLFLLGIFAVGRFFLLLTAERLGLDPSAAAAEAAGLLALLALATALAALPGGWLADRIGRPTTMTIGGLLGAFGVILLAGATSSAQLALFGGLMAVGTGLFTSANWAMTTDLVPPAEAARWMGLANVGTAGAAAVAGLFGPLADLTGSTVTGVVLPAAVVITLSAVVARLLAAEPFAVPAAAVERIAT